MVCRSRTCAAPPVASRSDSMRSPHVGTRHRVEPPARDRHRRTSRRRRCPHPTRREGRRRWRRRSPGSSASAVRQPRCDRPYLAEAVELIARQVEQRDDRASKLGNNVGNASSSISSTARFASRVRLLESKATMPERRFGALDVRHDGVTASRARSRQRTPSSSTCRSCRTRWRCAARASSSSASGASRSVTRAPMTDPSPRFVARDAALVARPSAAATRVRIDGIDGIDRQYVAGWDEGPRSMDPGPSSSGSSPIRRSGPRTSSTVRGVRPCSGRCPARSDAPS